MPEVAFLLLGWNFLLVMGYAAGPLGVVLLSKFSMMLGQNRLAEVRDSLEHLVRAVLDISVFASLQLVVFADVLVRLWVGPSFRPAIPIIRLMRSEEHTSELQSRLHLVCRLLLEKKTTKKKLPFVFSYIR